MQRQLTLITADENGSWRLDEETRKVALKTIRDAQLRTSVAPPDGNGLRLP